MQCGVRPKGNLGGEVEAKLAWRAWCVEVTRASAGKKDMRDKWCPKLTWGHLAASKLCEDRRVAKLKPHTLGFPA